MLPKFIEEWGGDSRLYDSYLASLEPAPVVQAQVRSDKLWMKYDKLSADNLRVLLRAAGELVQRLKAED